MKLKMNRFQFTGDNAILFYIALFKFFLLLLFAGNYGLFRDEFYYLECSKHLDWGYVDQPPLSLLILAISRTLFGESILGIRIFAYVIGSATVFVTGLIARELGGKRFEQIIAASGAIFSGVLLGGSSYFSMNAFDVFFSSILFLLLIKLMRKDNPKLWIAIGILFGIGLQNKLTFLFLAAGLFVGLIITKNRKYFLSKELYFGAASAFIIFLPHIIWQVAHHFPTLEFMRNAAMRKNQSLGLMGFASGSVMELSPFNIVFLLSAMYFFFFHPEGKKYSLIAWAFITIFLVFVSNNGKPYYMGVLFPVMIAAGVVGTNFLFEKLLRRLGRYIMAVMVILSMIFVTPFALPVLSLNAYLKFSEMIGIKPSSGERQKQGVLPQFYADRFGWKEMVEKVAFTYNKLTEEEKQNVIIFGQDYGEAGAVNYYAKESGLPERVFSSHNSYWFWGPPKDWNESVAIIIGSNNKDNGKFFEEVELAASHYNKFGMPFENVDIFICRKTKIPFKETWGKIKNFI
jgi:hypothetical protein